MFWSYIGNTHIQRPTARNGSFEFGESKNDKPIKITISKISPQNKTLYTMLSPLTLDKVGEKNYKIFNFWLITYCATKKENRKLPLAKGTPPLITLKQKNA